ncbi:MAG: non-homologous end-joining DNA ligase [Actinomycetota bacterium]|nr:non-homologous end-joining DNA ligase [Actinomycetota bacterium]
MTRVTVEVEGRQLSLSNLDKVLYPAHGGFTKGEVLDYYSRIAPVLLPHLARRPLTMKRWPDGVEGHSFFEKNAPSHRPDWLRVQRLPSPGSTKHRETIDYAVVEDVAGLIWVANLATLELHTPMWRIGDPGPDLVVFDLDPGPPATAVECAEVALLLREELAADGREPVVKTSGNKGLQVYALAGSLGSSQETSAYAKDLAQRLEGRRPDLVVSRMAKALRPGKVLVDWSQNNGSKTTVSVYSLRARPSPTVSTPVTWDEVAGCRSPAELEFLAGDVLDRVARDGDLFRGLLPG